ncbi:Armadillo/beta-catenin-like repeat protein [Nitzschia inconspicua]|uniref:Armadillo/beta-catenin-like repeat protein n=1 Tax=Nitzschia inconspicua TaxID=303405 RepID=A0A9K3KHT9_9STRA|nr:Armadillo/beta-catenin-like repeat protein [Nitzschia inconspicua]
MATKRVRALERAGTPEQIEKALRKIVSHTNIELDSIFGIEYRNEIVHAGGLKAILRTMREHHNSVTIQDLSCQALSNLAFENDKMRLVVAQLGGISAILKAMSNHQQDENLQWHAIQALWRLTLNDWVRDRMAKKGSADVIRQTMAAHPSSKENVQFWGELALKHLKEPPSEIFLDHEGCEVPDWLIDFAMAILLLVFFLSLY